jgi:hypothetical protein
MFGKIVYFSYGEVWEKGSKKKLSFLASRCLSTFYKQLQGASTLIHSQGFNTKPVKKLEPEPEACKGTPNQSVWFASPIILIPWAKAATQRIQ